MKEKSMRNRRLYLVITIVLTSTSFYTTQAFPKLGILKSHPNEAIIEREYPFANSGTLTIRNIEGSIRVQTEWRGSIALRATKRAAREEQLGQISIEKYKTLCCRVHKFLLSTFGTSLLIFNHKSDVLSQRLPF